MEESMMSAKPHVTKTNFTRGDAIAKLRQNDDECELEESERMNYHLLSNGRLREELILNEIIFEDEMGDVVD